MVLKKLVYLLIVISFNFLSVADNKLYAQFEDYSQDNNEQKVYVIKTNSGGEFIGVIISQDDREVLIETKDRGRVVIPKYEISEMREVIKGETRKDGSFISENVFATDFDKSVDVIPISDPNIFSMTQRIVLAQTQLQMAQAAPDIHNLREAYRKMYLALNIKDIDSILPQEEQVPPRDPISEQQAAMTGNPIKAFEFQNHEAYVAAHSAFLQNPMIQQNPAVLQAIGANIQEHQAMLYRVQIEQALGQPLPQLDQPMPPEMMNEIAVAAATATQQVTGQAQAMAQAQAQAQQDPQREMFEQQLQQERDALMQKETSEQRRIDLEMQKAEINAQLELERIEANRDAAEIKTAVDLQELELKNERDVEKNFNELVKTVKTTTRED